LIFADFHLFSLIVRWLLLIVVFFGFRWSGGWVVGKWWEGGNGKGMKISSLAANVRRMNVVHFWFWAFLAPPFADFQCMPDTAFLLSMPLALCQSTPACPEGTQAFALRHKTRGIERTIFSGHSMLPVGTHVFLCAMCVFFCFFYDFRWLFVDCLLIVIDVWWFSLIGNCEMTTWPRPRLNKCIQETSSHSCSRIKICVFVGQPHSRSILPSRSMQGGETRKYGICSLWACRETYLLLYVGRLSSGRVHSNQATAWYS